MTWGPELRREVVELFVESGQAGRRRHRLPAGCDRTMFSTWLAHGFTDGLGSAQRAMLEALTVERRVARCARKIGQGWQDNKETLALLERRGLVHSWKELQGRRWFRMAEITQDGWRVLLGARAK